MADPPTRQDDWIPRPDPTILTTEQLHREIGALEARMNAEVEALKTLLEASIRSMEEILDARTEILDTKVEAHEALDVNRFDRIDARFNTVEKHRMEQKDDTNLRLDYTIATLKERADEHFKSNRAVIEKTEQAFTDSLSKQAETFRTTNDANLGRIDDLKERIAKVESVGEGASAQRQEGRQQISSTTAIIGTVIAVIGIGLALLIGRNADRSPTVVTTPTVTVQAPAQTP